MARLIMRRGPTIGAVYELLDDVVTIGRGRTNKIIIHDNEVSREHCRLIRVMDDYELEDLNASNGTFVNGQRVIKTWLLRSGMLVELGDTITLEYERNSISMSATEMDTQDALPPAPPPEASNYALRVIAGPDTGREYALTSEIVNIGRELNNDIVIQDPEVSRSHVRLRRTAKGYEIEDLNSTNGTKLNKMKILTPIALQEDDTIGLGTGVRLKFITQRERNLIEEAPTLVGHAVEMRAHLVETTLLTPVQDGNAPKKRRTSNLGTGLEPGALENHVFIAYARDDWEPIVAQLTSKLQDAGLQVWVDQYLTENGPDWRDAVEQAMFECWLMVLITTSKTPTSPLVRMAYRYFANRDKPMIPLIYEEPKDDKLSSEIVKRHRIVHDLNKPQHSTHRLIYAIKELRKQGRP